MFSLLLNTAYLFMAPRTLLESNILIRFYKTAPNNFSGEDSKALNECYHLHSATDLYLNELFNLLSKVITTPD